MIIGLISDTHDNISNILKAKEIFRQKKVELIIHAGDIIAPKTVEFFQGIKTWFVKGNCDGDTENIDFKAEKVGGKYLGDVGSFDIGEKEFCVYHGTDKEMLRKLIQSKKYDYIITGHTHDIMDFKEGKTRVINPGAHYYMSQNSIAILDTEKDSVEFIDVTNGNKLQIH